MSAKNRTHTPAVAVAPREAAFQDAVVLVREPFVIDRAVAMQAIRYTKELLSGSVAPNSRDSVPSSNPSTSRRRAASGR